MGKRRKQGIFFSGSSIATEVAKLVGNPVSSTARFLDPAVGAGDLLLACASRLPVRRSTTATLREWGTYLSGRDIHPELVNATRIRLALLAALKCEKRTRVGIHQLSDLLPNITAGSGLRAQAAVANATDIVMNPPFTKVKATKQCSWAQGSVTNAAIFLTKMVKQAKEGTRIVSVLPDVLRSGSRYKKWRSYIEQHAYVASIKVLGRFNASTDVHVFLLQLQVGSSSRKRASWELVGHSTKRLSDYVDVRVGPVVDFRHRQVGAKHPFVTSKGLRKWGEIRPSRFRRFEGTLFEAPFVVVRRTSRPEDLHRAVATIVRSDRRVAVENHLMVLLPKDGSLETCRRAVQVLKSDRTSKWLNSRIRCRHLTVPALEDTPWVIE